MVHPQKTPPQMIYDIDKFDVDRFEEELNKITDHLYRRTRNVESEADAKSLERWFWNFIGEAFKISTQTVFHVDCVTVAPMVPSLSL